MIDVFLFQRIWFFYENTLT